MKKISQVLLFLSFLLLLPTTAQTENIIIFAGKDLNKLGNLITIPNDQVITSMEIQQACWVPGLSDENHYIYSPKFGTCRTYDFAVTMLLPDKSYFTSALKSSPLVIYDTFMGTTVGIYDWAAGIPDYCPADMGKLDPGVCGCGTPDTDSDGDRIADCIDICPDDPNNTDTDNDGTPDCIDSCPDDPNKTQPEVCGCGFSETDLDNDDTPDCTDGCVDDPLKTDPGVCGCSIPDADQDENGVTDCLEDDILFFPIKDKRGQTIIIHL